MIRRLAGGVARCSMGAGVLVMLLMGAVVTTASAKSYDKKSYASDRKSEVAFERSWTIEPGKSIEIRGVNGSIHARSASGDEVEVVATKHWRKGDPSAVRVDFFEDKEGVTVCVLNPGQDCDDRDHRQSRFETDVSVEFEVRVPRDVRLVAQTVNGGIDAENLDGPVVARTVNGSVNLVSRRTCEAATVNGSISAELGTSSWDDEIAFTTVNGGISLLFPPRVNARLDATTMNGHISSDFDLTSEKRVNRRRVSGTIGRGGPGALKLSTVNGNILLRSAD